MANKRTAKVENFRLTPEQKDWQKKFKAMSTMRALLEAQGFTKMAEMKDIQQLYRRLMIAQDELNRSSPIEPYVEISGMDFREQQMPTEPSAGSKIERPEGL